MDIHSKEVRSYNMSQVRSKNTKPEEIVRKYLYRQGFRYRKNVKDLPGKPDVVLAKYHTVIFVNGCFWHMHKGCKKFTWPQSNKEFWENKIKNNCKRDEQNISLLKEAGWKVIIIWECELKKTACDERLMRLCEEIKNRF